MLFIQSLTIFISLAAATTFQAFDGKNCKDNPGRTVCIAPEGSCEKMAGRGPFYVDGDNVKAYYYSSDGCHGTSQKFTAADKTCHVINTPFNIVSLCVVGVDNKGCGYN